VQAANIEVTWSGLGRVKLSLQSEQAFSKIINLGLLGRDFLLFVFEAPTPLQFR